MIDLQTLSSHFTHEHFTGKRLVFFRVFRVLRALRPLRFINHNDPLKSFVKAIRPDIKIVLLRGNVDTRINKLEKGQFDAMILASCGLKRIGYENRISKYFDPDKFVPAGGQGAICGQVRKDDELYKVFSDVSCKDAELSCIAERKVLEELGIGCRKPFGVFARFEKDTFIITAKAYVEKTKSYIYSKRQGPRQAHESLTSEVIEELRENF